MGKYIDMHCHILPGIDDGAKNLDETRKMLQTAYEEGIRYIIATPHFHPKRGHASKAVIKEQIDIVRQEAKKIDDNFRVFPGQEIYFGQDIPELIADKTLISMNLRNYCLVEFSSVVEERYLKQSISQLQAKGMQVILAHVERYQCVREDIELAEYLCDVGVLLQVNADSIIGKNGIRIKKFVKKLLDSDMVFCVGTDAHDSKTRPPHMKKAAEYVEKKYGEEHARRIFFSNAAKMLKK